MSLSRRDFLVLAGLSPLAFVKYSNASELPTFPIVDTHCHVMTIGDIPAHGMARHYGKQIPTWVIDFAVWALTIDRHSPGVARVQTVLDSEELKLSRKEAAALWEIYSEEVPGVRETKFDLGAINKALRWVKLMGRPQYRIVEDMIEDYPQVQLFTPSMVDLDGWGAGVAKYCVRHQIARLERLMKERRFLPTSRDHYPAGAPAHVRRVAVHPIVAFNPLKMTLGSGDEYFALIEDALLNRGFIGVKIYPAAGFHPMANTDADIREFISPALATKSNLADSINRGLARLYEFCNKNQIPIMAHCDKNSAEPPDGSWTYGHPKFWKPVLETYKDLKLNLAHFGGDWRLEGYDLKDLWTYQVAELMEEYPGRVYGDLGYQWWIRNESSWYKDSLEEIFKRMPASLRGIMYGSDWLMLYKEKDHKSFFELMVSRMGGLLSEQQLEDFLRYNAQRYFGLDDVESPAYKRLLCFYRKEIRERSPDWLGEHSPLGWFSPPMDGCGQRNEPLPAECFLFGGDACQRQLDRH